MIQLDRNRNAFENDVILDRKAYFEFYLKYQADMLL